MHFKTGPVLGAAFVLLLAGSASASPADNKQSAINAMTDLFSKQDPKGVDRYFTSPYHQHNTRIPDGLDALKKLAQDATTWTGEHTNIHRALADKDMVVLQSTYWNLVNRHEYRIAFDLFRFDNNGKIVEHWDALEGQTGKNAEGLTQTDGATKITDLDKTEANRATVKDYLDAAFLQHDAKRADSLRAKPFLDHQPDESQRPGYTSPDKPSEARYVKIHRTLAEGNFVFVQSEGRLGTSDNILEIYDLFRVKNGKVVEHWDVHQPVSAAAEWANKNGPF